MNTNFGTVLFAPPFDLDSPALPNEVGPRLASPPFIIALSIVSYSLVFTHLQVKCFSESQLPLAHQRLFLPSCELVSIALIAGYFVSVLYTDLKIIGTRRHELGFRPGKAAPLQPDCSTSSSFIGNTLERSELRARTQTYSNSTASGCSQKGAGPQEAAPEFAATPDA